MTHEEAKKMGATHYVIQRGVIVYCGWYRWTGSAWEHYCWYQNVKPL